MTPLVPVLLLLFLVFGVILFFLRVGGFNEVLREFRRNAIEIREGHENTCLGAKMVGATAIEFYFPIIKTCVGAQCAVCLCPVEDEQPCRKLQCEHIYHADCILDWWVHRPRIALECPMCRAPQTVGPVISEITSV
mmetsp:Transcript_15194/g.31822  ORF Transcript_15194/g.31822 Transcript_15194/m.31822 type:complete len:136 (+) Transcript_15194:79-486(+)